MTSLCALGALPVSSSSSSDAGRGMSHGTFGVTGDARPLDEGTASAIMNHQFTPLKKLNWRSAALQFGSVEALINALESSPSDENLTKAREADDLGALKMLGRRLGS